MKLMPMAHCRTKLNPCITLPFEKLNAESWGPLGWQLEQQTSAGTRLLGRIVLMVV